MSDLIKTRKGIFIPDITVEMFRNASLEAVEELLVSGEMQDIILPSAEQEIIRCKDCKWWDKYSDRNGYCHAAKHGYMSSHWEISIYRTYKEDFYCADAEPKGEQE